MLFIPSFIFLEPALDLTTLSFIAALLLLSILSLCFVFHLRFKSRKSHHLQSFNHLWTVRFLLISFISFWAINELIRIPFFRRRYLYPFLFPLPLSDSQQINLCKIQIVLSLGCFEPAFLVILLFLVNASIRKKSPHDIWAIGFVLVTCLPFFLLQIFFVFFSPKILHFPEFFDRSHVVIDHEFGEKTILCAYPLSSSVMFGLFGVGYAFWFLLSCWKVVSMVINNALRGRINMLALTILVSLPVQILFLGLSVLWRPDEPAYGGIVLVVFFSTFLCAAMGEGILVIKPISESLSAGGDCCQWIPLGRSKPAGCGGDDDDGRV